ncbi:MAG: type II and III secretion system protein [Acidobacteria bacterium]|nr:type II and III secretion system protein [Acidobacteriota bacterium]
MRGFARTALFVLLVLGGLVFVSSAALSAQETEASRPALATSAAFRLQSQVAAADFELRGLSLRTLYQAIADAYGIRLLYDADLDEAEAVGDFRIQNATLDQALEAAASISKTFVAPLDERTGIVAEETPQKRGEYERNLLLSFRMDPQTTPQQLTEVSTALRTLLDLRRVAQDTRLQWISARGMPRQVEAAERFVQTLQKEPGEVLLEVEVWEINLSRARELGIVPPQTFQLLYLGNQGANAAAATVPLLTFGEGRAVYGVRVPNSEVRATFSSSVVHSYQSIQLRASHGQPASLLIGQRYPITTVQVSSSFREEGADQQGASGLGFFPTIQYEDLGVTLKATPYLHAFREITLNLDLALRNLGAEELNGIPVIANRQMLQQVRLRDGESYLIGGLLSPRRQETRSGIPLLSRLPLIGRLFGSRSEQRSETELLVQIRPHILRPAPAEEFASRTIFFGRELTGLPTVEVIPGPPPAEGAPPVPGAQPVSPGIQPAPVAPPGPEVPATGAIPPGIIVPQTPGIQQPTGQPEVPSPDIPQPEEEP